MERKYRVPVEYFFLVLVGIWVYLWIIPAIPFCKLAQYYMNFTSIE